jgi:caffeoyl-CoA O-methyltransferase
MPLTETIHPLAEAYATTYSTPNSDAFEQVYAASMQHPQAHMTSSPVQGKLLEMLSFMRQPRYILEIGTFNGYSAICLAKGLAPGGTLHTIELREADAAHAAANFKVAGMAEKIILHTGNALEIIPTLPFTWDMVFIDADKTNYINYYELAVPRLQDNGIIIADNVLFHGQVLEESISGKNARAIDAFNKHVASDPRTEQVLLTVRDGLLLIKKK